MIKLVQHHTSFWLLAPIMIIAAGLVVRIFIFQHDCGHGSFFSSRKANMILGNLCGLMTFTPYEEWKHLHAEHHACSGDLERRGVGDILTMTLDEYRKAPFWTRFGYRLYRNPLILFVIGPPIQFVLLQRLYPKGASKRQKKSVIMTDLALVGIIVFMSWAIGLRTYLLIQAPIIGFASIKIGRAHV